jgi:hypothetical protein
LSKDRISNIIRREPKYIYYLEVEDIPEELFTDSEYKKHITAEQFIRFEKLKQGSLSSKSSSGKSNSSSGKSKSSKKSPKHQPLYGPDNISPSGFLSDESLGGNPKIYKIPKSKK